MADALPVTAGPEGASYRGRAAALMAQPAIRKALPAIAGMGALALVAVLWMSLSSGPQRVLYSSLSDGERAQVAGTLDTGGISYEIDNATGTLTVPEDDLYRARMLVASDGALAAPETGSDMLNSIPLGASRTLEGERLRNVRERELMLTIAEIDGVDSVRVHLATPQRSPFVRQNTAPTASVMLRLARGRNLSQSQVAAIVNLVAGSVPGMSADSVRVVDQHGTLLSDTAPAAGDGAMEMLQLQSGYEDKMRAQIDKLLVPMLGEGNFSSEVQVELDMSEVTSARESYDKEGVIRSETEMSSTRAAAGAAGGVPGVTANTPPPPAELVEGAPEGGEAAAGGNETEGETSARRTYELGREVAVTSNRPGAVARVTVAVALSDEALTAIAPATAEQIEELVSSAVGADPDRGDDVTVIAGTFEVVEAEDTPFYEASWFATVMRNVAALIAVILGLLFGVRPLIKALKRSDDEADKPAVIDGGELSAEGTALPHQTTPASNSEALQEQVTLARNLATQQPDRAATALRRMLAEPTNGGA